MYKIRFLEELYPPFGTIQVSLMFGILYVVKIVIKESAG
jgi:hypothetical protein